MGLLFPAGGVAMLPGGLSPPPRATPFPTKKVYFRLAAMPSPMPTYFLQGEEKELLRTKLCVRVKATAPLSALNFTVIIAQNFCHVPLLAFRGTVTHVMDSTIYPRAESDSYSYNNNTPRKVLKKGIEVPNWPTQSGKIEDRDPCRTPHPQTEILHRPP